MKPHKHMGIHEIAERLGLSRQRVHILSRSSEGFPRPADVLKAGKVWHTDEIEAWINKRAEGEP